MRKLTLISNHLSSNSQIVEDPKSSMKKYRAKSTINSESMRKFYIGNEIEIADRVFKALSSNPIFKQHTVSESGRKEHREITFRQLKKFFEAYGQVTFEDQKKDPTIMIKLDTFIQQFDINLTIKIMAQYMLYAHTMILLGTAKHEKFIQDAFLLNDIGCFALTELGHGSNVNGILTRADYDPISHEFLINTPNNIGMKFWLASAGQSANIGVIFAQLYVKGTNHGVHAFIVPLRNKKDYKLLPGVIAGDCGDKVGWNGIDNGFIIFKDVRVPYDNLLDRFSSIDQKGNYSSSIKNAGKRFALTISALSGGRVFIIGSSANMLVNSLTIATRFAAVRKQFGPPNQPEISILEYPTVQYRLMPHLAEAIALSAAGQTIRNIWHDLQDKLFEDNNFELVELHAILSAFKPFCSWSAQQGIQECREVCGGLGYSAYNRLGSYIQDNDVSLTGEGDNNVLLQQTAKFLLDCLRSVQAKKKLPYKTVYFMTENLPVFTPASESSGSQFSKDQFNIKKALETKANFLTHISAERIQQAIQNGKDLLEVWNDMQIYYFKEMARVYYDLYLVNEFSKKIESCNDKNTKLILEKLFNLCGYHKIEKGASVLFEVHYLSRHDLVFIREKIITLCNEIKNEAIGILDSIALPDHLLNSPIGAYDGDIYNRFIGTVWTATGAFERASYWEEIKNHN